MAPRKKIAQTVLTEGKFYTISAANGKVVEVAAVSYTHLTLPTILRV